MVHAYWDNSCGLGGIHFRITVIPSKSNGDTLGHELVSSNLPQYTH